VPDGEPSGRETAGCGGGDETMRGGSDIAGIIAYG
jgi:hypothetical protein